MGESRVYGELLDDLAAELLGMTIERHDDGTAAVDVSLAPGSPFLRALRRAEAEVMFSGDRRARRIETRRYDAFLLVVDGVRRAVESSTT